MGFLIKPVAASRCRQAARLVHRPGVGGDIVVLLEPDLNAWIDFQRRADGLLAEARMALLLHAAFVLATSEFLQPTKSYIGHSCEPAPSVRTLRRAIGVDPLPQHRRRHDPAAEVAILII